ncbi:MAG: hypothetical protein PSX79_02655 [bacterium]|nr:hypothetical protein [bacterium]
MVKLSLAAAAACVALFAISARAGELPALATYGQLPEGAEISPDGERRMLVIRRTDIQLVTPVARSLNPCPPTRTLRAISC